MINILAAAILAVATPAQASPTTGALELSEADLRCFAVGIRIADMGTLGSDEANAGTLLAIHALGRLEGRSPETDWVTRGIALANTMPNEIFNVETVRCGDVLTAKSDEMLAAINAYTKP